MVFIETVSLVACQFPSAGAQCIIGDIYGKNDRETVRLLYRLNKASNSEFRYRYYTFPIHVYPITENDGRLKLSNWDHEFNPMSPYEMNVDDIIAYFVTEQYLEPMFGMDVDGDSIMLIKTEEFDKVGFTQEMVDAARHQVLEKRGKKDREDLEFLLHKCGLPAYINNAVELAIESGLVVQPERRMSDGNL